MTLSAGFSIEARIAPRATSSARQVSYAGWVERKVGLRALLLL